MCLLARPKGCEGCPLYRDATQVVFGEGKETASIVLVGEQPGDQEDRQGRPFVGPSGGVLERALAAAGLARDRVYLTNAVKHFKFEPRGKRRLHQKPRWSEIKACRPWLEAELDAIAPRVIVTLGATAARPCSARVSNWARCEDVRCPRAGQRSRSPDVPSVGCAPRRSPRWRRTRVRADCSRPQTGQEPPAIQDRLTTAR